MKIGAEMYAFIEHANLMRIIEGNKGLKDFVGQEMDRMRDEGIIKRCGGCGGGCCSGCGSKHEEADPAYLTAALMSVFNYYIPEGIKNEIHMGGSTYIDE